MDVNTKNSICWLPAALKVNMNIAQSRLTLCNPTDYSPWNSPGQNTGVGSLLFLQGIFPTQGSNPGLLQCRRILYIARTWQDLPIWEWAAKKEHMWKLAKGRHSVLGTSTGIWFNSTCWYWINSVKSECNWSFPPQKFVKWICVNLLSDLLLCFDT